MVWPAKSWNVWLVLAVLVGLVLVLFVPVIAYTLFAAMTGQFDRTLDPTSPANLDFALTVQVITYFPVALYFAGVLPALSHLKLSELGFRAPSARELAFAAAGTVVMFVGVSLASVLVTAITHRQDTEAAIALLKSLQTVGQKVNFILVGVVLAPMVEELVFRVFLFNFFSRYSNQWTAMVLSGVIFGMIHAAGKDMPTFVSQLSTVGIPLSVGGITLAYIYARTRNYWACVTTHVLFNAVGVVQVLFFHGT